MDDVRWYVAIPAEGFSMADPGSVTIISAAHTV